VYPQSLRKYGGAMNSGQTAQEIVSRTQKS
jgi:hypothetical protein